MAGFVQGLTREHGPGLSDAGRVVACVTGVLSTGAGVIHVSAAADHQNLPVMMVGFIVVAALQVGLGGLLIWRRPHQLLLLAALGLMLGSVGVWLVSRTSGLPFLPGGHMDPIGFKDSVTVLFELATVPGLLLLMSPDLGGVRLPSARLGSQALAFISAFAFTLFVPALILGGGAHHAAGQAGHPDAGGHPHGDGQVLKAGAGGHGDGGEAGHRGDTGHDASGDKAGSHAKSRHGHEGSGGGKAELAQADTESTHGGHGDSTGGSSGSAGDPGPDTGHGHGGGSGTRSRGKAGEKRHPHKGGGKRAKPGPGHGHGQGGTSKPGAGHGHGGGDSTGGGGHGHAPGGGGAHPEPDRSDPPSTGIITQRVGAMEPKAAGTKETIKLQYGPFTLAPGADASWPMVDLGGAEGFMVSAKPSIRFADGTEVGHDDGVHLHHAHLFRRDQDTAGQADGRTGYQWIFGTGDEQTLGSFEALSKGDPSGKRYGVKLNREPMLMVWMPMNMTDQPKAVYLEFAFEFVHGSPEAVEKATGKRIRSLQPVLYGETFNTPKTGGYFAWPLDAQREPDDPIGNSDLDPEQFMTGDPARTGSVKPGVGHIWTAPSDGELVGAAGHGHEGLMNVTFSNLGSESSPCGNADGDRFPGTKVLESKAFYPPGMFPTHMKMGTSQTGWRVKVRKGDRIAINGVYDTRTYAWPDQMSVVGIYYDEDVTVADHERCRPRLVNEPNATLAEAADSVPAQRPRGSSADDLFHHMRASCVADGCNDYDAPPAPRGPHTNTVNIENFTFAPGDLFRGSIMTGLLGPTSSGAPVLRRGEKLTFVNHDYQRFGGTRHSIAACHGPCNGPDSMTYPNSNGDFYSGPMGYLALAETASNENQATPTWSLDTSTLEPGYHAYYCFQHRWMRGAFYLE